MSIEDQIDGAPYAFFRADKSVTDKQVMERQEANKLPEDLEGQIELLIDVATYVNRRGFGPTLFGMSLLLGRVVTAMYQEAFATQDPDTASLMLSLSAIAARLQGYAEAFDGQVMEIVNPEALREEMIQPMELMKNAKP